MICHLIDLAIVETIVLNRRKLLPIDNQELFPFSSFGGDNECTQPLVSSLNGILISRDQTRNTQQIRERSADSGRGLTATRGNNQSYSTRIPQSASSDKEAFKELQQSYEKL